MVFTFLELLQSEFVQAFHAPEAAAGLRRQDQIKKDLLDDPVSVTVHIQKEALPSNLDDGCVPWVISNLSCSRRKLNVEAAAATAAAALSLSLPLSLSAHELHLSSSHDDVEALCSVPLQILGLDDFVSWELVQEQRSQELLVDLTTQLASKASVAADLLRRLQADVKG
jgi:hypothetical protein